MIDETESIRRAMVAEINVAPGSREALEQHYGKVWSTAEMQADFDVLGFMAPIIAVRRRIDGKTGSLKFQHHPRFYFAFEPE